MVLLIQCLRAHRSGAHSRLGAGARLRRLLLGVARLGIVVLILAGHPLPVRGQAKDPFVVKAAFLCNFAKFTEWPAEAFSDAKAPFVIGVLGEDPFGSKLDAAIKGLELHGRPVVIRRFAGIPAPKEAHLLFVGADFVRKLEQLESELRGSRTLIVGDARTFAQEGGMIAFVERDGAIHFEVNLASADTAGLKLNSGLLKLADHVYKNPAKASNP